MKRVEPVVIKLAETYVHDAAIKKMLKALNASGTTIMRWAETPFEYANEETGRIQITPGDSEILTELAGRICYKSFEVGMNPNITKIRQDSKEYFANVLTKGDGSIFEHATVTFAFLNVSRVFTHELVRHRVGVAISQESLRYVRPTELGLWLPENTPPEIQSSMEEAFKFLEDAYKTIEGHGDWKNLSFDEKKKLTSLLRRILPNGMATNIIWTANHRTLRWVIEVRTHPSAEIEIRTVFDKVAQMLKNDYPLIYQDFERVELADGTGKWSPSLRSKV